MVRNFKYIFIVLLFLTSCSYIDVEPVGKVIPDEISEYRALLTTAYSTYPAYRRTLMVRSDEVFPDALGLSYDSYIAPATWNDENPDPLSVSYPWTEIYKIAFYTNVVIDGVMHAGLDVHTDTREQLLAEAYALRAFVHFDLVNLYAKWYDPVTASTDRGIPLALKVDVGQDFKPVSVDQVYAQIFSDLQEAGKYMQVEEQSGTKLYRFSKKSLQALRARVYLYHRDWQLAQEAAEAILPQCMLENLLAHPVKPWTYDSREAILSMEQISSTVMKEDMYVLENLLGMFNLEKTEEGYKDARVGNYLVAGYSNWYCNKGGNKEEKVTFRSAEIYLIAAEAAAWREGQLNAAKSYLLELLQNRLTENYYKERKAAIEGMERDELLAEIQKERARELCFEGHRWFDLRRTSRPEIVKNYMDNLFEFQSVSLQKDDPKYIIPFPREAVENNPELQN
jgi:hypothetical protein